MGKMKVCPCGPQVGVAQCTGKYTTNNHHTQAGLVGDVREGGVRAYTGGGRHGILWCPRFITGQGGVGRCWVYTHYNPHNCVETTQSKLHTGRWQGQELTGRG